MSRLIPHLMRKLHAHCPRQFGKFRDHLAHAVGRFDFAIQELVEAITKVLDRPWLCVLVHGKVFTLVGKPEGCLDDGVLKRWRTLLEAVATFATFDALCGLVVVASAMEREPVRFDALACDTTTFDEA